MINILLDAEYIDKLKLRIKELEENIKGYDRFGFQNNELVRDNLAKDRRIKALEAERDTLKQELAIGVNVIRDWETEHAELEAELEDAKDDLKEMQDHHESTVNRWLKEVQKINAQRDRLREALQNIAKRGYSGASFVAQQALDELK